MIKLNNRIQMIFGFRILSNNDISGYMKRMVKWGKVDEVKKAQLFDLILTKLGEIEDEAESLKLEKQEDILGVPKVVITSEATYDPDHMTHTSLDLGFKCPTCSKVLKTKLALSGHSSTHKKK